MNTDSSNSLCELNIINLTHYAYKHYIENIPTIELLQQATTDQQKEEIALIALLDVKDDLAICLSHHKTYRDADRLQRLRIEILQALGSTIDNRALPA